MAAEGKAWGSWHLVRWVPVGKVIPQACISRSYICSPKRRLNAYGQDENARPHAGQGQGKEAEVDPPRVFEVLVMDMTCSMRAFGIQFWAMGSEYDAGEIHHRHLACLFPQLSPVMDIIQTRAPVPTGQKVAQGTKKPP